MKLDRTMPVPELREETEIDGMSPYTLDREIGHVKNQFFSSCSTTVTVYSTLRSTLNSYSVIFFSLHDVHLKGKL